MELIGLGITGIVVTAATLLGYIEIRRSNRIANLVAHLRQYDPLFLSDRWMAVRYCVDDITDKKEKWQKGIVLITHKRIAIYPFVPDEPDKVKALVTIQPNELRGFWRPVKYMPGENEIWIHADVAETWRVLKMKMYHHDMQKVVRAMKEISTAEQTKAYRRRRPYIHRDLTKAFPAHQSLTGAWELDAPVQLYLMPLYLVILVEGRVVETIDLTVIQDIAALKRMEGGKPEGLVRFFVDNVMRAFALNDYEAWANDLAEAAKRTLEEPVTRKRKSKDDDDDDDFDED